MIKIKNTDLYKALLYKIQCQLGESTIQNRTDDGTVIYVDAGWSWLDAFFARVLFAKGMQKNNERTIAMIVQTSASDVHFSALAKAIDGEVRNTRDIFMLPKAIALTGKYFLFHNSENSVDHMQICGIDVGMFYAEHLVRFQHDIDHVVGIRWKDLRLTVGFIWGLLCVNDIFRRRKPYAYLAHETDYWGGAVTKFAMNYGARCFEIVSGYGGVIEFGENLNVSYNIGDIYREIIDQKIQWIDKTHFNYKEWTEEFYNNRFKGKSTWLGGNVFIDKNRIGRQKWHEISGSDPCKKNIFIMAHCFSDCSYSILSKQIFKCFYDWLIETLEIIKDINNVNWVLKAHPNRLLYDEGNRVYDLFDRYSSYDNISIMDDSISPASLLEIADGAVTVCGTCGVELTSHGIPVVCAGLAPYGGKGFTVDSLCKEDYIEQLHNMDRLGRLSDDQIDMARKVTYPYMAFGNMMTDEFEDSYISACRSVDNSNRNDAFVMSVMQSLQDGYDIKDSYYYKKGMTI